MRVYASASALPANVHSKTASPRLATTATTRCRSWPGCCSARRARNRCQRRGTGHAVHHGPAHLFAREPRPVVRGCARMHRSRAGALSEAAGRPRQRRFSARCRRRTFATLIRFSQGCDLHREDSVERHGSTVPLSANFRADYGIGLTRSGFPGQSLRTLSERARHRYAEHRHDAAARCQSPDRSGAARPREQPKAWANVGNDVRGDEVLHQHSQMWQVW